MALSIKQVRNKLKGWKIHDGFAEPDDIKENKRLCIMQAVNHVLGRAEVNKRGEIFYSDRPPCVSPVLIEEFIEWNDGYASPEDLQKLPNLIPDIVGTYPTRVMQRAGGGYKKGELVHCHTHEAKMVEKQRNEEIKKLDEKQPEWRSEWSYNKKAKFYRKLAKMGKY